MYLIESVNAKKPPIQCIADKISKFTYFILFFQFQLLFLVKAAKQIWPDLLLHNHNEFLTNSSHTLHSSLGSNAENFLSLAIQLSIAVLVIACPCALGLATPLQLQLPQVKRQKRILFKGGDTELDQK